MRYVKLGRSDIEVSAIGMGVWQASKDWRGSDSSIEKAVAKSHELGVTLMDTAEAYGLGHSEKVLGRAIRKIGRNRFVIATKVYGEHLRFNELQQACRASASRLGVDKIDIYQVHWPNPWAQIPLRETMKALEKLYLEGRIGAIAVSNFAVRDLEEARSLLSKTDIVSNQVRYNLLQREIEEEVIPYCKKEGISVIAYSPLAQGALTGKYDRTNTPKGDVRDSSALFVPNNMRKIEKLVAVLSKFARMHKCSTAQVALSWLMSKPMVIPIPGAKNAVQAEENAGASNVQLAQSEVDALTSATGEIKIDYFPSRWP